MENKYIFGDDVQLYDMWRPRYHERVFETICDYARLNKNSRIIEIGCGTGQATEAMLKRGFQVHAIEASDNMCKFVNQKFAIYPFEAENKLFEEAKIKNDSVDLVLAATSFHWVDEKIGYEKIRSALKEKGCLALLWNHPFVSKKDDPLHLKINEIYKKYIEQNERKSKGEQIEDDWKRYERIYNTIKEYGFSREEFHTYKGLREFSAKDYISLLNTYSDHKMMSDNARREFEDDIEYAIESFGGVLKVYDTMELYLATK